MQASVATTAKGREQPGPDHTGTEDKHDAVGTSLKRVPNSVQDHQDWILHGRGAAEGQDESDSAPDAEEDEDERDEDQFLICYGSPGLKGRSPG